MFEVNDRIRIPEAEFHWTFVRAGGPGGQNVNKVASKAVLHWGVVHSPSLPEDVRVRLRVQQRGRINAEGQLVLSSQRFRDQGRNVADCLDKLRAMVVQAATPPRVRKRTRPGRAARENRLDQKRHRAATKQRRRFPRED